MLYHDKNSKHRFFVPGELEIFGTTKTIREKLGPLTFSVQGEDGSIFKRHLDHLRIQSCQGLASSMCEIHHMCHIN